MTETATTGASALETATGVILAGGVAWFLTGFVGDAASAEALSPPTEDPGHKDDPTCPNPKTSCTSCMGEGGICTTGSAAQCACDGPSCPVEEPACANCNGKDGKR